MIQLIKIIEELNQILTPDTYQDYGYNGLQVDSLSNHPVEKVALAVDSGLSVIEEAIKQKANLLIVHHGLFWNENLPITGALARKLQLLLLNGCSLYAAHLPLDGHIEVGNAVQLAKFLGLDNINPAFEHKGSTIGITANSSKPIKLDQIINSCKNLHGSITPTTLNFGNENIINIGIVTGSGSSAIDQAHKLGLDLLISGEPQQKAYHLAKELHLNVLFIGHYASETLGVIALGEHLKQKYKLDTIFINEPTGI